MERPLEQRRRSPFLYDASAIHYRDAIAHAGNHAEIMRDQDDGEPEACLQRGEQIQGLRLDGHVESRGRLVRNQELWLARERHGDHHPLAHASGELVRILRHPALRRRDADKRKELDRAGPRRSAGEIEMMTQDFADLRPDREQWVERRHRVLEDDCGFLALDLAGI